MLVETLTLRSRTDFSYSELEIIRKVCGVPNYPQTIWDPRSSYRGKLPVRRNRQYLYTERENGRLYRKSSIKTMTGGKTNRAVTEKKK